MFQKKNFVFSILLIIGLLTACGQQNDTESIVESDSTAEKATVTDDMKEKFGENCISEQTFEVELSEYGGKVYFVPLATADNRILGRAYLSGIYSRRILCPWREKSEKTYKICNFIICYFWNCSCS